MDSDEYSRDLKRAASEPVDDEIQFHPAGFAERYLITPTEITNRILKQRENALPSQDERSGMGITT